MSSLPSPIPKLQHALLPFQSATNQGACPDSLPFRCFLFGTHIWVLQRVKSTSFFLQNFKTLKFLYDFIFHQIHESTCTFIKGTCFYYTKSLKSIIWLYAFLFIILKESVAGTFNVINLKDSKWHLHNIQIIFKFFINLAEHHFIYWHTTIHYNYNNVRLKKSKFIFFNPLKIGHTFLVPQSLMNPSMFGGIWYRIFSRRICKFVWWTQSC